MCILFFAIDKHPQYPVIICANRDEFHQRPTQAMHQWLSPEILAGKDLQAGGTWLGLSNDGKFSALANYRQSLTEAGNKKSRGELVLNALTREARPLESQLPRIANDYNGFNLVFGHLNRLICFDSVNQSFHKLTPGFHSICNGALDDIWPKMALGQEQLAQAISQSANTEKALDSETLFALMRNCQQATQKELPDTGIALEWEQLLSSIFIVSKEYGTRSTTILMQNKNGDVQIYERSYSPTGQVTGTLKFSR